MKKDYKAHTSSLYKKANLVALFAYVPAFLFMLTSGMVPVLVGYLILAFGLVVFFLEKKSSFVKIHALNSALFYEILMLYLYGMDNVFYYTGWIDGDVGKIAFVLMHEIIMILVYLVPVYCMVRAYQYKTVKIPFLSDWIDKIVKDK